MWVDFALIYVLYQLLSNTLQHTFYTRSNPPRKKEQLPQQSRQARLGFWSQANTPDVNIYEHYSHS